MFIAQTLLTFDGPQITDAVSGNTANVTGVSPTFVTAPFGNGYQMNTLTNLEIDTMQPSTAFTLGFWLRSTNPGMATNPDTQVISPLVMPVVSKSNFVHSNITKMTTVTQPQFVVWEETQGDGTNVMKVRLYGTTGAIATTYPYTCGNFHYFWIVYRGSDGTFKIYVDLGDATANIVGTVPLTVNVNSVNLGVNVGAASLDYQFVRNSGVLDDLVAFGSYQGTSVMTRAATYGAIFVADDTYANAEEIDQVFVFDDQTTIQINSVFSSSGNLFVARSDGKLLKGVKSLWQSRRNFGTTREVGVLTFTTHAGTKTLPISNGALLLQDEIVTL